VCETTDFLAVGFVARIHENRGCAPSEVLESWEESFPFLGRTRKNLTARTCPLRATHSHVIIQSDCASGRACPYLIIATKMALLRMFPTFNQQTRCRAPVAVLEHGTLCACGDEGALGASDRFHSEKDTT